jgi:hypothetical protein
MSPSFAVRSASACCLLGAFLACSSGAKPKPSDFAGAGGTVAGTLVYDGPTGGAAGGSLTVVGGSGTSGGAGMGGAGTGGGGTGAQESWTLPPNAELASCLPTSWTIKASSSAQGNPPEYAVDGLGATRWSSGAEQAAGTFYEIDFGGWVTLHKVVLDNSTGSASDYPRGYEVRASRDAVDFSRIASLGWLDFAPANGVVTIDFDPVPLQAVQIATTEHSLSWWSIQELRLGCKGADDGVPPADPLACTPGSESPGAGGAGSGGEAGEGGSGGGAVNALDRSNWTATASSTSPDDTTHGAIDGSIATRWSTGQGQVGGEWFQLDLGGIGCISSVFLASGGGDAAIGYVIEVSVDGVTYEQVAKGAGNPVDHIQFKPHSARYVRVTQKGAGGANWWSIQEIEVS